MVFMAQKVKMCPPKYTKYKIDLTGQYTWKFENTPGQYGLKQKLLGTLRTQFSCDRNLVARATGLSHQRFTY